MLMVMFTRQPAYGMLETHLEWTPFYIWFPVKSKIQKIQWQRKTLRQYEEKDKREAKEKAWLEVDERA